MWKANGARKSSSIVIVAKKKIEFYSNSYKNEFN